MLLMLASVTVYSTTEAHVPPKHTWRCAQTHDDERDRENALLTPTDKTTDQVSDQVNNQVTN